MHLYASALHCFRRVYTLRRFTGMPVLATTLCKCAAPLRTQAIFGRSDLSRAAPHQVRAVSRSSHVTMAFFSGLFGGGKEKREVRLAGWVVRCTRVVPATICRDLVGSAAPIPPVTDTFSL